MVKGSGCGDRQTCIDVRVLMVTTLPISILSVDIDIDFDTDVQFQKTLPTGNPTDNADSGVVILVIFVSLMMTRLLLISLRRFLFLIIDDWKENILLVK